MAGVFTKALRGLRKSLKIYGWGQWLVTYMEKISVRLPKYTEVFR